MSHVLPTAGVGCVDQRDFRLARVCEPGQGDLETLKVGVRVLLCSFGIEKPL